MPIKIAALADLHLGKISTQAQSNKDLSTSGALDRIAEYCLLNDIDLLLMAGDIIDRDNKFFEAYNPLRNNLLKLAQNDVSIYIIAGNHDYNTLEEVISDFKHPNIHYLGKNGTWSQAVYEKGQDKVQIIGWSFPSPTYDLSPFSKLKDTLINKTMPTIGLVHGDYNNPQSQYAPLPPQEIHKFNVDVWILGHIHKPRIENLSSPLIFYPGSPQAMSPKEKGKHGIDILEYNYGSFSHLPNIQISTVKYEDHTITIPREISLDELRTFIIKDINSYIDKITQESRDVYLVLDLIITGFDPGIPDINELYTTIRDTAKYSTQFEIRKVETQKLLPLGSNFNELAQMKTITGQLAQFILNLESEKPDSELTKNIIDKIKNNNEDLIAVQPYLSIKSEIMKRRRDNNNSLKDDILNEAYIILSHFIQQQNNN